MDPGPLLPWIQALSAPVTALLAATGALLAASIQAAGNARAQTIAAEAAKTRDDDERDRRRASTRARLISILYIFENDLAFGLHAKKHITGLFEDEELSDFFEFCKKDDVADALTVRQLSALHGVANALRVNFGDFPRILKAYELADSSGDKKAADGLTTLVRVGAAQALRRLTWFYESIGEGELARKSRQYMNPEAYEKRFAIERSPDIPERLRARYTRYGRELTKLRAQTLRKSSNEGGDK